MVSKKKPPVHPHKPFFARLAVAVTFAVALILGIAGYIMTSSRFEHQMFLALGVTIYSAFAVGAVFVIALVATVVHFAINAQITKHKLHTMARTNLSSQHPINRLFIAILIIIALVGLWAWAGLPIPGSASNDFVRDAVIFYALVDFATLAGIGAIDYLVRNYISQKNSPELAST